MRFNIRRFNNNHSIGEVIKLYPTEIRVSEKHSYGIVLDNFGTFDNKATAPVHTTLTEYHILLLRLSGFWLIRKFQLIIIKSVFK